MRTNTIFLAGVVCLLSAAGAAAQDFGRNGVARIGTASSRSTLQALGRPR